MKYNDYELLYLITEYDEYSLNILFRKYEPLIKKRLKGLNISEYYFDDYYQEALMIFYDCINKYNPYSKKTFNKYLDMMLKNRLIDLIRKENKNYNTIKLPEVDIIYEENKLVGLEYEDINFSTFEKSIYELRFIKLYKINEVAKEMNCDSKRIYNAINRIKEKINTYNNDN